jgi:hypothetical protein
MGIDAYVYRDSYVFVSSCILRRVSFYATLSAMIRNLAAVLLVAITPCALAQSFHWDAKKSHELVRKNAIRFAKELSPEDRSLLLYAIVARLRPGMADLDIQSEKQLLDAAADTRIEVVDLDGDGKPEVIAQSWGDEMCGATGNCAFWIFKKIGSVYKAILIGAAQTFAVEETGTNGFRDVTLGLHDSATKSELRLYRFSEGRYHKRGCFDANWAKEVGGPILKKPIITHCPK